MTNDFYELQTKAYEIFTELTCDQYQPPCDPTTTIFGDNADYWKLGCVFDTLLDYMQMAVQQKTILPLQAEEIVGKVLDKYNTLNGCWYDDYAWWGVLSCKAYDPNFDYVFGKYKENFQQIAKNCWNVVQNGKPGVSDSKGAPNVYNERTPKSPDVFVDLTPRFEGGVWQYDMYACPRTDDNCASPPKSPIDLTAIQNPCGAVTATELGPYQQSVMIGLYLLLAQRLADFNVIPQDNARSVFRFIEQWVYHDSLSNKERLLNTFDGNYYGIIRERVSTYLNGTYSNFYEDGESAWAGDQGLFIGGLLDHFMASGNTRAYEMVLRIIGGTFTRMTTRTSGFKIINYWYPEPPVLPLSNDPGDYTSGIGVFFRYLLFCANNNPNILNLLREDYSLYKNMIDNTVAAAYSDILPTVTNGNPIFEQFNRLAILTAAMQILYTQRSAKD